MAFCYSHIMRCIFGAKMYDDNNKSMLTVIGTQIEPIAPPAIKAAAPFKYVLPNEKPTKEQKKDAKVELFLGHPVHEGTILKCDFSITVVERNLQEEGFSNWLYCDKPLKDTLQMLVNDYVGAEFHEMELFSKGAQRKIVSAIAHPGTNLKGGKN